MNWSDVGGFLSEIAPSVGQALKEAAPGMAQVAATAAGNAVVPGAGGLVGAALGKRVADALGASATPQAVVSKLQADPEAAKTKLRELEIELTRLYLHDRQDARAMQVATLQADNAGWLARNFVYLLGTLVIVAVFAYIGAVTFVELTPTGERYADIAVTGIAAGLVSSVMGFFLGSRQRQDGRAPRTFMDAIRTK
ncbi:hypothetical protein [Halomonas sp. S2151]|jgi:hypothetical protein|uniref:hypothetical protein n=1 Tax=Halomonas sp. S2151 TaxID=579478 RepID=UPI000695C92C|nr:hypothetical protein [Halomonas sp. S2151]